MAGADQQLLVWKAALVRQREDRIRHIEVGHSSGVQHPDLYPITYCTRCMTIRQHYHILTDLCMPSQNLYKTFTTGGGRPSTMIPSRLSISTRTAINRAVNTFRVHCAIIIFAAIHALFFCWILKEQPSQQIWDDLALLVAFMGNIW